jgi:hypothetical protein
VVGFAVVARGVKRPALRPRPEAGAGNLPRWLPPAVAVIASAVMVWLALIALHRNGPLLVVSTGPLLALWLPALAHAVSHALSRLGAVTRWRETVAGPRLLVVLVGVLAPLVLFALSAKVAILADRAFLIFVPCLLLLAAGAVVAAGSRLPRIGATAALLALFAASVPYSYAKPGSPNDYKTLVARMQPDYRPDDLVFVLDRSWVEGPLFYYLPDAEYVFADYEEALKARPAARVWLVTWPYPARPVIEDERREALARYRRIVRHEALRASAELFVPPGAP